MFPPGFSVASANARLIAIIVSQNRRFFNRRQGNDAAVYYIEQTAPEGYQKPTVELLEQYEEQLGLPRGADDDVIGLAHAYSKKAIENGDKDLAVYFLGIFCGLTDDEEALKLLDSLTKDLSEE